MAEHTSIEELTERNFQILAFRSMRGFDKLIIPGYNMSKEQFILSDIQKQPNRFSNNAELLHFAKNIFIFSK